MKIMRLDIRAYHSLEKNGEVTVSEGGVLSSADRHWAKYHIRMNRKQHRLEYSIYLEERDGYGYRKVRPNYSLCRVYPLDFELVSSFNR